MTTTTFPPCQFDGDPNCGPVFVPVDNPPNTAVIDAASPAPVALAIVPGVEMCLPSGSALLALFPCDPACGYITFSHGAVVCHGATVPGSTVRALPRTGATSAPVVGTASGLLLAGLLAVVAARRGRLQKV